MVLSLFSNLYNWLQPSIFILLIVSICNRKRSRPRTTRRNIAQLSQKLCHSTPDAGDEKRYDMRCPSYRYPKSCHAPRLTLPITKCLPNPRQLQVRFSVCPGQFYWQPFFPLSSPLPYPLFCAFCLFLSILISLAQSLAWVFLHKKKKQTGS